MPNWHAPHAREIRNPDLSFTEAAGRVFEGGKQDEDAKETYKEDGANRSMESSHLNHRFVEEANVFWQRKNVENRSSNVGTKLKFFPNLLGASCVDCSEEEWENAAEDWKWSLVGMVFGAKPSLGRIKSFVRNRWDEGAVSVGQMDQGIFQFNFATEEARDKVLDLGPWTFDSRPLILQMWSPDENYSLENVSSLPVWVRFPRLNSHLRKPEMLSKISSLVGKPLRTDGFTSGKDKLAYARVLVEVFASMDIKRSITINGPRGTSFVQRVEYDWLPLRCSKCQTFGHGEKKCSVPTIAIEHVMQFERQVLVEPLVNLGDEDKLNSEDEIMRFARMDTEDGEQGSVVPETQSSSVNGEDMKEVCSVPVKQGEVEQPFILVKRRERKRMSHKNSQNDGLSQGIKRYSRRSMRRGIGAKIINRF